MRVEVDAADFGRVATWVESHGFRRIAVQFPDELLPAAPRLVTQLQQALAGRKVFLLGDSTYGSSGVDEVGAEHYCADCLVHVGPSDQQHAGTLPVLFVFGRARAPEESAPELAALVREHFASEAGPASIVLVCDVALQHTAAELAPVLEAALNGGKVLVAEPRQEALAGHGAPPRWRDWRFGALPLGAGWWTPLGAVTRAAAAQPEPLRICGREVRCTSGEPGPQQLPAKCGFVLVSAAGSALERRLLLRHGHAHPVWRVDAGEDGVPPCQLSSQPLLLQRYRYVELARSAAVVGLLLCTTEAALGQAVAKRLEQLLRSAGRRVYRFVVGRLAAEKLGNFPDVECYVALASPEHFPWSSRDMPVPVVSPYEMEVALGAREWTGDYVTDLQELLVAPLGAPTEEALNVQVLGSSARMRHFAPGESEALASRPAAPGCVPPRAEGSRAPAEAMPGLHGVAARYASEEPLMQAAK